MSVVRMISSSVVVPLFIVKKNGSPLCKLYETSLVTDMEKVLALDMENPHHCVVETLSTLVLHDCIDVSNIVYSEDNENTTGFCKTAFKNAQCKFSLLILDMFNLKKITKKVAPHSSKELIFLKTYKLYLKVRDGRDCENSLEVVYAKLCNFYEISFSTVAPRGLCCGTYNGVFENGHMSIT